MNLHADQTHIVLKLRALGERARILQNKGKKRGGRLRGVIHHQGGAPSVVSGISESLKDEDPETLRMKLNQLITALRR